MTEPQFRQSQWRRTSSNAVCSITLLYNGLMHQTQIRIPLDQDSKYMRSECTKAAQDMLWEEMYKHKKGFEPISKRRAVDGTEYVHDPLMRDTDDLPQEEDPYVLQLD